MSHVDIQPHGYNLKHILKEQKSGNYQQPQLFPQNTPPVHAAPNQPSANYGGLSKDQYRLPTHNDGANEKVYSTNRAANNPNNNNNTNFNYKNPGINNPENRPRNINPDLKNNKTPFQLIKQLCGVLERYGLPTLWEPSIPCPCVGSDGYPKVSCPICHGLGLAFQQPLELSIAFQDDNRQYYSGASGLADTGTAIATPEMTENGYENGIAPRDRLSIPGLQEPQTYIFNVNKDRIQQGEFIPYNVKSIDLVQTMNDEGTSLITLHEGQDFTFNYDASVFHITNKNLLNRNITMRLSVARRFYVTNVLKETRYATATRKDTKQVIMGQNRPNSILTNYVRQYKQQMSGGEFYYRMPKKLVVRREDVVLGNWDISDTKSKAKRQHKYVQHNVRHNINNPLKLWGK